MVLRRWWAARRRETFKDVWPISEAAGQPPPGWPGWPDGKQFALAFTHDVESPKGLGRCRQLAALEAGLGFRSSFNFVPEGYHTPKELRDELAARGFEIGVHDLKHDGKLYSSRKGFRKKAGQINGYLKEWGAVGFRSAFMLHKLEWLHDLNIRYDASTFDTDPFEPQPDGVDTIFPFWVSNPRSTGESERGGYVELPYTLVQDFNLFIVLRERTIDVWKQKLDWIASRGGMAFLDTHPDYMAGNGDGPARDEYPVALYQEFLEWVKQEYAGRYWNALPRDVARFCVEARLPGLRPRRKNVCMLAASVYESDNRVMRYAQTFVRQGDSVDVIAVAQHGQSPRTEVIDDVRVVRVQNKMRSSNKWLHLWASAKFLLLSSIVLSRNHLRRRYDVVHVHNMPDYLVFSAWLPRLTGAKIILDIHDIFPEFYASKFKTGMASPVIRLLKLVERLCTGFADHVIVSNHLWRDTLTARSVPPDKCSVFINSVDTALFRPCRRSRKDGKFVIIYPGSFNWHQGLDIAVRALALIKEAVPGAELHLYGMGPTKESLARLAGELGLNGRVRIAEPMPLRQIPELLANADVGVVPKRASDFFGNQAFSTKIMEFMSQGLPAIVSRTRIDTYYYDESVVRFFESDNAEDLARAFRELAADPELRERLSKNGREFVARNSWETQKQAYLALVNSLNSGVDDGVAADPERH